MNEVDKIVWQSIVKFWLVVLLVIAILVGSFFIIVWLSNKNDASKGGCWWVETTYDKVEYWYALDAPMTCDTQEINGQMGCWAIVDGECLSKDEKYMHWRWWLIYGRPDISNTYTETAGITK